MLDIQVFKSKIDEIYEDKKDGDGWAAWSALCMWLAQYEYSQKKELDKKEVNHE